MLDSYCISKRLSSQFIKDRPVSSLGVFVFEFLGASFSRLGCFVFDRCFVFEFWVLRFRDLGASFSSFGCFVFEIWVLRSSFSSASFSKLPVCPARS